MLTPNPVPELKPVSEPRFDTEFKLVLEPCATKLRLKTALRAAMDEIIALTIRHMEAVRERADLGFKIYWNGTSPPPEIARIAYWSSTRCTHPDIIADRASRAAKAAVTKVTNVTMLAGFPGATPKLGKDLRF